MPLGTRHVETGRLNVEKGHYLLRRDEGGTWRLELGWFNMRKAKRLAGQSVKISGVRSEFDLLDVTSIVPLDRG